MRCEEVQGFEHHVSWLIAVFRINLLMSKMAGAGAANGWVTIGDWPGRRQGVDGDLGAVATTTTTSTTSLDRRRPNRLKDFPAQGPIGSSYSNGKSADDIELLDGFLHFDGLDSDSVYRAAFDAVESLHEDLNSGNIFGLLRPENGDCARTGIGTAGAAGTASISAPPRARYGNGLGGSPAHGAHRPAPPNSLPVKPAVEDLLFRNTASSPTGESAASQASFNNCHSLSSSFNGYTGVAYGDELSESELHLKREKAFIERVIEQHEHLSEQKRRNDILELCERLQGADRADRGDRGDRGERADVRPKSSRIKTNGSLPRDKCGGGVPDPASSPLKSSSSSDDIHQMRLSEGASARPRREGAGPAANANPVHTYVNVVPKTCSASEDVDYALHLLGIGAQPSAGYGFDSLPTSPSSVPGSPRRGIKTVLSTKETFTFPQEITHEVVENHLDLPAVDRPAGHRKRQSSSSSSAPPSDARRVAAADKHRFILPLDDGGPGGDGLRRRRQQDVEGAARDSGVPASPDSNAIAMPERVMALSLELEFVQKERLKIMSAMTAFRARLGDLQAQREEAEREAAMEQAFIRAELETKGEKVRAQQGRIFALQERADQSQNEMDIWQEKRNQQQRAFMASLANAEAELHRLREELEQPREAAVDEAARAELRERVYAQADVVDSEKKAYEDLEFKYLEEESEWLAKKEELHRDLTEAIAKYDEYAAQVAELESWVDDEPGPQVEDEQRLAYEQRLDEGQAQLDILDARILELVKQGAVTLDSNQNASVASNGVLGVGLGPNDSSLADFDFPNEAQSSTPNPRSSETSFQYGAGAVDSDRKAGEQQADADPDVARNGRYHPQDEAVGVRASMSEGQTDSDDTLRRQPRQSRPVSTQSSVGDTLDSDVDVVGDLLQRSVDSAAECPRRPRNRDPAYRQQRPLTRYLPVRTGSLDLRQHIESAGHAVELCREVAVDASSCRGVLHKASGRFRSWQKRWFVFDRDSRTLAYYKSRRDERPRGGVSFQSIAEVYVDHLSSHKNSNANCVFVVKTLQRAFHLMAPTPEAMRIWVDVIFTGAEAYQEFDS